MKKILILFIITLILTGCASGNLSNDYSGIVFDYHDSIVDEKYNVEIYSLSNYDEICFKTNYYHTVDTEVTIFNYNINVEYISEYEFNDTLYKDIINNISPIINDIYDYYSVSSSLKENKANFNFNETIVANIDDRIVLLTWYIPIQVIYNIDNNSGFTTLFIPFNYSYNVINEEYIYFNNEHIIYNDFINSNIFI